MSTFIEMQCGECGIEFHVPEHFYRERRNTGKGWYCPNGHSRVFRESDADKFRREAERLRQMIAQRDDEILERERQLTVAKGQITKLKKRSAAGTCPCCRRAFKNMAEHMKHRHPDFVAESGAKVVPIKRSAA